MAELVTSFWEEYEFTPQEDMTAYELAMILKSFRNLDAVGSPVGTRSVNLGEPLFVRSDDPKFASEPFARHFVRKNGRSG